MKKRILSLLVLVPLFLSISAQKEVNIASFVDFEVLKENRKQSINLDEAYISKSLHSKSESIVLPFLNDKHNFTVEEFSIHDGGGNPFPEIKTYKLYSKVDKTLTGRITSGPAGVSISYLSNGRIVRIYPDSYDLTVKRTYSQEIGIAKRMSHGESYCSMDEALSTNQILPSSQKEDIKNEQKKNGSIRRIYRVALICTGEWSELNGGGARQLAISSLNDISSIFEKDMSIEMVLSSGSPLMRSNSNTDEFIPNPSNRPSQAQNAIENAFNTSRYDLGHVFHRSVSGDGFGSGGVAGLGVICNASRKASGWSSSFNTNNNAWIQLAAHEFGHMYNSPHTFNGIGGSCDAGNHPASTAYEIGSGTTIMSYQGICDADYNIPSQGIADNYFHVNSLNRMTDYAETFGICNDNAWIIDNNNEPEASANPCGAIYSMPRLTPFMLIGEATDADGDALTYNWEQYDEDGPGQRPTHGLIGSQASDSNNAPLYRSYPPSADPTRTIPLLSNLANNISSDFEVLTRKTRSINFRFVVRDNNPAGGAVDWDQITIKTTASKGPLSLLSQENGDTIQAGSTITVDWNTRNSDDLCDKAVIKLSTDGGLSFPFEIAKNIDYAAGTAQVIIPASFSNTEKARIMIACDDYECFTFFDITNRNFTIESNCFAPASLLCDDSDGTFLFGDPNLDFDEDVIDGSNFTSLDGPLEALETMNLAVNDQNNNCTVINGVNNPFQEFKFSVTQPGSYTFRLDNGPSAPDENISAYSIFDKATFNSTNPCPSFIASNARQAGNFTVASEFSAILESCKEYLLVAMVTNTETNTLALTNIEGPGFAVLGELTDDYALTFMAFDAETEEIIAISDDADFVSLPAGEYFIKSAFYKISGPTPPNNVDPTTLIGLTQSELLGGVDCIFPSGNEKEIIIEATCFVQNITEVSRTACNPLTNTFDITLSFDVDMGPGTGEVTINGQTFDISSASATVTLTGIIANGDMIDLDFKFTDDKGCDRIYADVFQASQNCCPIVIDLGIDRSLCIGEIETLDGGTDGNMFAWYRDGDLLSEDTQVIEVTNTGLYTVQVTNETGCVNEASVNLSFESIPTASLSLPAIDACFGEVASMELFTNVNDIVWFRESTVVATNTVVYGVTEPGSYSVVVTSEFGCTQTAEFEAVFKDAPVVDLGEDFLTCNGAVHILDAQLSGFKYSYEWRRNFFPAGDGTQFFEVTTFGIYSVTVTDNDNSCESVDTISIDYEELPDFNFASDKQRCDGDNIVIEAEESDFTINWYFNDELIPGVNTVELTAEEAGIYVAAIEQNDQCMESDTFQLTILDSPNLDLPEVISACPGEDVILMVNDQSSTFEWSAESGTPISETSNTLTVTVPDTYYIYAFNNTTFCEKRDTVEVTFSNVPILNLGPDITACDNETITLESVANGFQVQWYFNNQLIQGESGSSIQVNEAGEYRILIDQGGACTSEDVLTLTYNTSPDVDLGIDRSACPGDVITLDGGDASNVFIWSSDEDGVLTETSNNLDVIKTGIYYVSASGNGCTTLDTVVINFADLPSLDLGDDVSNCEGDLYTISIDSEGFDLEWTLDDEVLTGQTSDDLLADQSGTYIVKISAGTSCSVSDTIEVLYTPFPVVDLGDDSSACPGDVIELVVEELGNIYIWSSSLGGQLAEKSNTLSVTETATYSVEVTNSAGCTTTDMVLIEFSPLPDLNLGADVTVCQGEDVELTGSSNGFDIEWYLDNVLVNGENGESLVALESGTYIMKVASSPSCAISDTVVVSFIDAPVVDLGDDRSACPSDNIVLDGGDAGNTYVWTSESGFPISETSNMLSITESDTYYVEASNGACSSRDTVSITFTELPMLDLGADVTVCQGEDVQLTGISSGFDIEWYLDDVLIAGENGENLNALESGTYIMKVASSPDCAISDTVVVSFIDAPIVDLGDDRSVCPTDDVVLDGGEAGNTFVWTSENGLTITETASMLAITESDTYYVESSNGSCSTRDTVTITFAELPMLDLGEDVTVCQGEDVQLSGTSNGFSVEWSLNDVLINGENGENLTVLESGTYIMKVASSPTCAISDTVIVSFINAPIVDLGDDRSVCPTDNVVLDGGESGNTFVWTSENGLSISETSSMLAITESDTYFVESSNGSCSTRDTVTITFTELPLLDLGDDINDICEGADFELTATTNGFETSWLLNDEVIIGENNESLVIEESGIYIVVASASSTCETRDTIEIALVPAPVLLDLIDELGCEGTSIELTAGTDGEFQYTWSDDNGVIQESGVASLMVSTSGTYTVEASDLNGCVSTETAVLEFIAQPTVEIDESLSICDGEPTNIQATSNVTIIDWYFDGAFLMTVSDDSFEASESGEYVAIVGAGTECEASDTIIVTSIDSPQFIIEGNSEVCSADLPIMFTVDLESNETIQWFFNTNEIDLATTGTLEANQAGEYSAVVTNSNNCQTSINTPLAIFESSSNILSSVPQLCEGDVFTMEASTDGSTFEYRDGAGTVLSTSEESLDITESGTYSFVSFNDIGCETLSEFEVIFEELPTVDLGPAAQAACIGVDVIFDIENIPGATYEWSKDGEIITGEVGNTLQATGNGDYSVVVTNSAGCSATGESSVTFFDSPTLSLQPEISFCTGTSASLSITTDANIIRWILDGNVVANDITTFDVLTGGTYIIEVESSDGCVTTDEIEVIEVAAPSISIDNIELCPGESQEITLDPGFSDYFWDGIMATGSSATINFESFTQITTQNASVTVMNQTGCSTTEEFTITYFPPINALVASSRISSCVGESEMLQATGGLFYEWTDPSNSLSQTDIANPIATPTETTIYMVAVSDNCPGNISNLSVEVIVNDLPIANAGMDTCAIAGLEFSLNASGGIGYKWDNSDLIVGSANIADATILITEPTTFTVTVTDDNGCQSTDDVDLCILEDPLEVIKAVTVITPNGDSANDELVFNGLEAYPDNVLTVFNRWGNVIFKKRGYQNDALRWDGTRDGLELPADTYYYILEFSTFKIKKSITILRN